jgi:hypothetical protein
MEAEVTDDWDNINDEAARKEAERRRDETCKNGLPYLSRLLDSDLYGGRG